MAHKGRGIFLVYVDIDAEHDKEFNECNWLRVLGTAERSQVDQRIRQ
jgi:hypothetical protein